MKTIGLIGGMSWESTIPYYSIINQYMREKLGGLHSARIILYSVEFDEIEKCQSRGEWEKSGIILGNAAKTLEDGGAEIILICTNTMHKVYQQVKEYVSVPVLHIADATGDILENDGRNRVALLGTKYTMTQDFYRQKLIDRGFDVIIPEEKDIELINHVIFDELCLGIIEDKSKNEFARVISELKDKGAEAVILGCTEIGNLIKEEDSVLPVYDTTMIHATRAAELAIDEPNMRELIEETTPIIKALSPTELENSLDFVWKVFLEFEAVNYPEEGKSAFYNAIHSKDYLGTLTAYGAFVQDEIIGILATRNEGAHIALFFVDGKYQRRGIGRKLFDKSLEENDKNIITVHSSEYALEVYKKLGFTQTAGIREDGGIRFIPMILER